ncbi:MAG: LytR/AlgR family response regulator transcription factor [Candidatus Kapaibacteriota bacterium]
MSKLPASPSATAHDPIRAVIVEDSPRVRETVKLYLDRHFAGRIIVIGEADDVDNSVALIRHLRPQLLLLDIELLTGTCFDVLDILGEEMRSTFAIVMITQFDKYLKQALRYGVVDYVDKPILTKTFVEGIERGITKVLDREATEQRLRESVRAQLTAEMSIAPIEELPVEDSLLEESPSSLSLIAPEPIEPGDPATISVRNSTGHIEIIKIQDITHCLASGSYTFIHRLHRQPIMDGRKIKRYEEKLLEHGFVRISRGVVINPTHCQLMRDVYNVVTALLPDGSRYRVENSYIEKVTTYIQASKLYPSLPS